MLLMGEVSARGGGALGYFLGGYVPPWTPNWHPVLKKFPLKLIPRSRIRPKNWSIPVLEMGQFFILRSKVQRAQQFAC